MKTVLLIGATGLIGRPLVLELVKNNFKIILLSRNIEKAKKIFPVDIELSEWDYLSTEKLISFVERAEAIINLAGANIGDNKWTKGFKEIIYSSRINTTKAIVNAISLSDKKPKVFLSASAIGIYGNRNDEELNEDSAIGNDFLAKVCSDWENAAIQAEQFSVRVVLLRTGIVLDNKGGALKKMLLPFKLFVGGPIGNGKQWFSWIHIKDQIEAILFLLNNENISGAINLTSPSPVTMKQFARSLGRVLSRPSLFNVPEIVLKLILGEGASAVTASQRVYPNKLINAGYKFYFENIDEALKDLCK